MAMPFKLIELILIGLAFSIQVQICSLNGQIGLNVTSSAEEVSASGKGLVPVLFQMETVMTAAYVDQSHSRNHATWNLAQVGFSRHLTLLSVLRFPLSQPQGPGSISKWTEFNSLLPLVNGGYTAWTAWSTCSRSCGPGITSRHRTCTQPVPAANGKDCSVIGEAFQQKACFLKACEGKLISGIKLSNQMSS